MKVIYKEVAFDLLNKIPDPDYWPLYSLVLHKNSNIQPVKLSNKRPQLLVPLAT